MKFGKYAIVDSHEYHLEKEPDLFWRIKPVTSGMELDRSKFLMHKRVVSDAAGNRWEYPPTWVETAHREIALTFGGTNIENDEGEPALKDNATIIEVENFLKNAPQELVMELWREIGRVHPFWGPADPNELKPSDKES